MAPSNSGANFEATYIEVGPSAPPIMPIAAACFKLKSKTPRDVNAIAPNNVAKIPNCAAAPRSKVLGLAKSGPKSVIAPTPIKIINGATGKNNTTEVKLDKFVVSEKFNSGFALDLMVKDVSIANSLIKDLTTKNPLSKSVSHYLSKTLEELGGNPDHTEVYKVL